MLKVNRKYSLVLFAVLMSVGMSFAMSLTLTLVNVGLANFWERWPRALIIGFIVSVPTSLLITPIVRRIVNKLTTD